MKSNPDSFVFYSRMKGYRNKMTQTAVAKQLRKYAAVAHEESSEVPLDLHAHQIRHAKASHWLEDGMNIVQISFLLGHADVKTTMVYLDITTEQEERLLPLWRTKRQRCLKWKKAPQSFVELCGLRPINDKIKSELICEMSNVTTSYRKSLDFILVRITHLIQTFG